MTTSPSHSETAMSPYSKGLREYASEVLQSSIFGAFILAIKARKLEDSLTQEALSKRLGKDKTSTSKLLSEPRNWQTSTISDMAIALDLIIEIRLIDRNKTGRAFTPTGVEYDTMEALGINGVASQMNHRADRFCLTNGKYEAQLINVENNRIMQLKPLTYSHRRTDKTTELPGYQPIDRPKHTPELVSRPSPHVNNFVKTKAHNNMDGSQEHDTIKKERWS